MTTATVISWPTRDDLARVSKFVYDAELALDELDVSYSTAWDGLELDDSELLPTFEELGRLAAFIECVDQDIELMTGVVEKLRQVHHDAAVRMNDAAREAGDA